MNQFCFQMKGEPTVHTHLTNGQTSYVSLLCFTAERESVLVILKRKKKDSVHKELLKAE